MKETKNSVRLSSIKEILLSSICHRFTYLANNPDNMLTYFQNVKTTSGYIPFCRKYTQTHMTGKCN